MHVIDYWLSICLQHMMTEWMTEKSSTPDLNKPLSIKTDPLEVSTMPGGGAGGTGDYVRCLPSPHASSLTHLRRSSASSAASTPGVHTPKMPGVHTPNLDTSLGSAKKVSIDVMIRFLPPGVAYTTGLSHNPFTWFLL